MSTTLNWGILGTGAIAKSFAQHLTRSKTGRLLAVASRANPKAESFAHEHGAPRSYASYDALLADPDVQAVYIATPHTLHAEWGIRACHAKKHVLVEKPLAVSAAEGQSLINAARSNDVFLMEGFMYRSTPQTHKLLDLLRSGAIGQVRTIHASFSFHWPPTVDDKNRITDPSLAGGGILDVGCYTLSFARLIAGVAQNKPFAEPTQLKALGHIGKTGIDEWSSAVLKFPNDIVAQLSCGVQVNQESSARIYGSDGWIHLPSPWVPARDSGTTQIILHREHHSSPETIEVESPTPIYALEADLVAENLPRRQAPSPAMSWDDSLGNLYALDTWRREIGLKYPFEKQISSL